MKPFAIDLNDRALSLAREGSVLSSAPSAVWDGSTNEPAGSNAWHALRRYPTATSTRHLGLVLGKDTASDRTLALVAAELTRRLAEQGPTPGERVWVATPGRADADGLGAILGIGRSLSLQIDGFVDSAAVSAAALGLERGAIVLELGMHHAAATAVDRDAGQARRRRATLTERGGLMELRQAWLEFVSTTLVKRTRFDPLHDAATEQQLFDALDNLVQEAAATGSATAVLTKGEERFEVALTRDQLAQAAQPIYRELVRLLHELRPAGTSVALVMPRPVAQLPGLKDELEQFVGCELVSIPDGFAAAAVSLLEMTERTEDEPVRLLRHVPSNELRSLMDAVSREVLGRRRSGGPRPSHLLLDGHAYALGAESLIVGRAPGASRAITLPDGLAGVSRRHCTFIRDGEEVVLLDHSNFGTYVNGERVVERVRVHAGDRVRLGEPGVELSLIAVGEVPAGPA